MVKWLRRVRTSSWFVEVKLNIYTEVKFKRINNEAVVWGPHVQSELVVIQTGVSPRLKFDPHTETGLSSTAKWNKTNSEIKDNYLQ